MRVIKYFCVLFLVSIFANLYLISVIQNSISLDVCLKIRNDYVGNKRSQTVTAEISSETEITTTRVPTSSKAIRQTTKIISVLNDNEFVAQWNMSLIQSDNFVTHCITEEVLGRVPNTTLSLKFTHLNNSVLESPSERAKSFLKIFHERAWGRDWDPNYKGLSASGRGSTIYSSQEVIAVLHNTINKIKRLKKNGSKISLLDAPCGDMVWMSRFLSSRNDVDYTGMDIIPDLIDHHREKYKGRGWNFVLGDVVAAENLNNYDIILCRMLIQHLHSTDVKKLLRIFSRNTNGLLIITTFSNDSENEELRLNDPDNPGRYRGVNLEIPPYSLTPPICLSRDGPEDEFLSPSTFIGVWKLPLRKVWRCKTPHSFRVETFNANFFSCSKWS